MIDVGVSQHNTYNRETQLVRLLNDRLRLTADGGVDQRETIILAHQVAVDEAQSVQLKKVVARSCHFHGLIYPLY